MTDLIAGLSTASIALGVVVAIAAVTIGRGLDAIFGQGRRSSGQYDFLRETKLEGLASLLLLMGLAGVSYLVYSWGSSALV